MNPPSTINPTRILDKLDRIREAINFLWHLWYSLDRFASYSRMEGEHGSAYAYAHARDEIAKILSKLNEED